MEWKRDLTAYFSVVVIVSIIEILLQKGPYSVVAIFFNMAATASVGLIIVLLIRYFKGSQSKKKEK